QLVVLLEAASGGPLAERRPRRAPREVGRVQERAPVPARGELQRRARLAAAGLGHPLGGLREGGLQPEREAGRHGDPAAAGRRARAADQGGLRPFPPGDPAPVPGGAVKLALVVALVLLSAAPAGRAADASAPEIAVSFEFPDGSAKQTTVTED